MALNKFRLVVLTFDLSFVLSLGSRMVLNWSETKLNVFWINSDGPASLWSENCVRQLEPYKIAKEKSKGTAWILLYCWRFAKVSLYFSSSVSPFFGCFQTKINSDKVVFVLFRPVYNSDLGVCKCSTSKEFLFLVQYKSFDKVLVSFLVCVYTFSFNVKLKQTKIVNYKLFNRNFLKTGKCRGGPVSFRTLQMWTVNSS